MTEAASAEPAVSEAKPLFTEGYKRLVLILLVAAYTLNFIDRTIISTIGQAIKDDLKLTDTQLDYWGDFTLPCSTPSWASQSRA